MSNISEYIDLNLYVTLFEKLDTLLPEFELVFRGKYWQSAKKNKLKTDGTASSTGGNIYIYENNPGILKSFKASSPSKNLISYISEREKLNWWETLNYLSDFANLKLPISENDSEQIRQNLIARDIWQTAEDYFHQLLLNETLESTHLEYLKKTRGFSSEDVVYSKFGYFPGKEKTKTFLTNSGYEDSLVDAVLEMFRFSDKFSLTIPVHDSLKNTIGFIFRDISPDTKDKYRYTTGFEKSKALFGYNKREFDRNEPLILVEGQIDSVLMRSQGWKNTFAINGAELSKNQLDELLTIKPGHLVLCLDNDDAGTAATDKIITQILKTDVSQRLILQITQLPEGLKDPNDVIIEKGHKGMAEVLKQALPIHLWLHQRIYDDVIDSNSDFFSHSEIERYTHAVAKYGALLKNPLSQGQFIDYFLEKIGKQAGITKQTIEDTARALRYDQIKESERENLKRTTLQAHQLLKDGDTGSAKRMLENQLARSVRMGIIEKISPYSFQQFEEDTAYEQEDLSTGIDSLDQYFQIPQSAITLVAARPSHGKTTIMLNLFYNMIMSYPEKKFYFFTYEEPAKYLMLKILNRMVFEDHEYIGSLKYLRAYQTGYKPREEAVEKSKQKLKSLIDSQRLNIFSFNYTDEQLAEVIRELKKQNDIGAVFIDYIQKIPVQGNIKGYEVIKKVSSTILNGIAVPLELPVILGAQFNREASANSVEKLHADMLRESGDLEQDANLILGLLNHNFLEGTEDDLGKPLRKGNVSQIDIKVLKNRNGVPGSITGVEIHGAQNFIKTLDPEFEESIFKPSF